MTGIMLSAMIVGGCTIPAWNGSFVCTVGEAKNVAVKTQGAPDTHIMMPESAIYARYWRCPLASPKVSASGSPETIVGT